MLARGEGVHFTALEYQYSPLMSAEALLASQSRPLPHAGGWPAVAPLELAASLAPANPNQSAHYKAVYGAPRYLHVRPWCPESALNIFCVCIEEAAGPQVNARA